MRCESLGLKLPLPIAVCRSWKESTTLLTSLMEQEFVERLSNHISQQNSACKSSLPSWEAAFETGFDEVLASRVLRKQEPIITNQHNELHNTIMQANLAMKTVVTQSKLQDHESTAAQVSIASNTLRLAKIACVVCEGVELISTCCNKENGPQLARQFLAEKSTLPFHR